MRRIFPLSGRMRNARRGMRIPGLPSAPIGDVVRPVRLLAGRSPKACDSAGGVRSFPCRRRLPHRSRLAKRLGFSVLPKENWGVRVRPQRSLPAKPSSCRSGGAGRRTALNVV